MTGIVSQIAAFIRAQLDEDEQMVHRSGPHKVGWGTYLRPDGEMDYTSPVAHLGFGADREWVSGGKPTQPHSVHVVYDPDRVLRRVGGMREILNSYDTAVRELDRALMRVRAHARVGVPDDIQATLTRNLVKVVALENVVLRLSLEYVDHDGYLDEWKQFTRPLAR